MNRIEIESTLNNDRVWLLKAMSELSDEQLNRPLTPSEHDPSNMWTAIDHFVHVATLVIGQRGDLACRRDQPAQ